MEGLDRRATQGCDPSADSSPEWTAAFGPPPGLSAELVQLGPNGQEELSAGGKALLDSASTENGDSIFESPIVIEGYCNGTPPTILGTRGVL